jgi:hypothetical protein
LVTGGAGGTSGAGGAVTITAGVGGSTSGNPGAVAITGAAGNGTANGDGGAVTKTGGAGKGSGAGGAVASIGGAGGATGIGGAISLTGGAGGATSGAGGAITITTGAGTNNAASGALTIDVGAKHGTGTNAAILIGTTSASAITLGKLPRFVPATIAASGTTIANAVSVAADTFTRVTGSDNTAGVQLPTAVAGMVVTLKNTVNTALLIVWPEVGDAINGLGANNQYNMGNGAMRTFRAYSANLWYADPETIV